MKRTQRGFTLVEILIVVIILGILAAIVIPQFTNASSDARNNSVQSTLQTARSQIELFKIQHGDIPPQLTGMTNWAIMAGKSDVTETGTAAANTTSGAFGPYLQQPPVNPMTGKSGASTATSSTGDGWFYSAATTAPYSYTFYARNTSGASITTW